MAGSRQGGSDLDYRLSFVRVFVTDWPRAIRFYTETLEMKPTLITDGWAQFATGEAQLAIEQVDPADPESAESVGRFVGVSFEVDDIDAAYETLTRPRRRVSRRSRKATVGRRACAPARPGRQRAHTWGADGPPCRYASPSTSRTADPHHATGHVTGADLIDYYQRLRAHPDFRRNLNEIFDATEVNDRLGRRRRTQLSAFTEEYTSLGVPVRVAIVASGDLEFGLSRMYEMLQVRSINLLKVFRERSRRSAGSAKRVGRPERISEARAGTRSAVRWCAAPLPAESSGRPLR